MALISCPECGHQVSDQAAICPNCGIKIAGNVKPAANQQNVQFTVEGSAPAQQETTQAAQPTNARPVENTAAPTAAVVPQQTQNHIHTEQTTAATTPDSVEYPNTDDNQPKKNKNLILMLSFIIALAVCIIGYCVWSNAKEEREEQQRYEEVMLSTNIQDLKDYLVQYNNAPQEHRDSVNARLNVLTQEDTDWTNAVASGSKNSLADFIKTHPNSLHKGEAVNLIDSIDYSVAERKNTAEAYAEYLKQHPDGRHASDAQERLDNKKATEVQPEEIAMAKDVYKRFFQAINAKNESKLLGTVESVMASFLGRSNASSQSAVEFMEKIYKDDITNMNWHILNDFKVEKAEPDAEGTANLKVQFGAEQNIERTDPSLETYAKYVVTGEVTPEGKITKFSLKKVK